MGPYGVVHTSLCGTYFTKLCLSLYFIVSEAFYKFSTKFSCQQQLL